MAVLVEAISVIARRSAIDGKYPGGWPAFLIDVPNRTLCYDDALVRIGFMTPHDVGEYVQRLENNGLTFLVNDKAHDVAVVDQQQGPTTACDWLEFASLPFGNDGGRVSACWLFEGQRITAGIHMPGKSLELHTPPDWVFEGSLSQRFTFVRNEDLASRLAYLRTQDGVDVFLDRETGKEVFAGRTS